MKNLESFRYEKMMFDALKENCQKVADEIEFAKKNAHGDERMWGYVEKDKEFLNRFCEFISKVIGREVSVYSIEKGSIQIAKDNPLGNDAVMKQYMSVEEYLTATEITCEYGEVFQKTFLRDDNKSTGGISFDGETLANFIDECGIQPKEDGTFDFNEINQELYDCGIETVSPAGLLYDNPPRINPEVTLYCVSSDEKEFTRPYAENYFGSGKVEVKLPLCKLMGDNLEMSDIPKETLETLEKECKEKNIVPSFSVPNYILGEFVIDNYPDTDFEGITLKEVLEEACKENPATYHAIQNYLEDHYKNIYNIKEHNNVQECRNALDFFKDREEWSVVADVIEDSLEDIDK